MDNYISVVIPCYNAEKTIERCISSLTKQTHNDIEILVIDDGSSDETRKMVERLSRNDGRIVLHTQNNCGVSAARNAGIEKAKGEYISFVDADDYVEKDFLSILLSCIEGKDISICRYQSGFEGENHSTSVSTVDDVFREMMIPQENIAAFVWNRLYRTSIIQDHKIRFNEDVFACEDTLFNFIYMQFVKEVGICTDHLYHYEINPSSAMFAERFNERKITANIAFEYMLKKSEGKAYKEWVETAAMWFNLILKRQIYNSNYKPTQKDMENINRMLGLNRKAFMNAPIPIKYKLAYPFWMIR